MCDSEFYENIRFRIAIFNVKYSPNMGDGAIAEALEAELKRQSSGWEVKSIDLAGRNAYGSGFKQRGAVMSLLQRLGPSSRETVALTMLRALTEFRLRPAWRKSLSDQDAVMIGGGQLIQGTDLNFPVKLDAAMQEVRRHNLPCIVYGVGVAQTLSVPALRLFKRAFEGNLSSVYVRDRESQVAWDHHFAKMDIPAAKLCWDPAILIDSVVPPHLSTQRKRPLIGLGLTATLVLSHHSFEHHFDSGALDAFWILLAEALLTAGFEVACFSNGAEEDELYVERLMPQLKNLDGPTVGRIPRPNNPHELAKAVASFDGIISHRLHANIIAFSYQKPHIGLTWDLKLTSFFNATGRPDCALPAEEKNIEQIVSLLSRDLVKGLPRSVHNQFQSETQSNIKEAASSLYAVAQKRLAVNEGADEL